METRQFNRGRFSVGNLSAIALILVLGWVSLGYVFPAIASVPDEGKEKPDPKAKPEAKLDQPPAKDTATARPATASPATASPATAAAPAGAPQDRNSPPKSDRQLAEERKAREAAKKRGELTFDDLKFEIEKGGEFKSEMITPNLKELDKKTVKLRGFILPTSVFQQTGIDRFVLVRDNQECCFGPGAALYDCVIVMMAPGKTTNFATRVVTVKGKLEIDTESYKYPDGSHFAVYKMTAEEVK